MNDPAPVTDPTMIPQKKCPWDGATPTIDKGLCNRKDLGRRTKSAFAYIRCPTCGIEKGVISMEGDHDEEAAVREAVKLWDTRPNDPTPEDAQLLRCAVRYYANDLLRMEAQHTRRPEAAAAWRDEADRIEAVFTKVTGEPIEVRR